MASIPLPIMLSQLPYHAIVSCVVLTAGTAGALTGAPSTQAVRGLASVQNAALNDTQDAVRSALSFCLDIVRQEYGRAIQGQLGLSDMVQLVAFCGFIQGIRIWRRRSASQTEEIGDAGRCERRAASSTKRSSTGNPKLGKLKSDPTSARSDNILSQMQSLQTLAC